MLKVATVVGARPQFVKTAALSRAFRANPRFKEVLIHTGQHYDPALSHVFFEELAIPQPDIHLDIGSASHGAQTGRMLEALEIAFERTKPDLVIVCGDTNSTLAGALAAAKMQIPVAHIEAGLRSFNRSMPEEINRVMVDHLSELLFAPNTSSATLLRNEGIKNQQIHIVGDVMYDVARFYADRAPALHEISPNLSIKLSAKQYILATVHRAESTSNREQLKSLLDAFVILSKDLPIVFPIHPRTMTAMAKFGIPLPSSPGLHIIPPVGYLDMVTLEKGARLIVTDSGGVQKEAYFFEVPCVTVREETEWRELIEAGWNRLIPPNNTEKIILGIRAALNDLPLNKNHPPLYGDGKSSEKILTIMEEWWKQRNPSKGGRDLCAE